MFDTAFDRSAVIPRRAKDMRCLYYCSTPFQVLNALNMHYNRILAPSADFREVPAEDGTVFSWKGDTFAKVLYTGMIDEFFDDCYGPLEYRSLHFENEELPDVDNFQGNAVVNYTEREVPFTRIIEHQFFEFGKDSETGEPIRGTIITREYPATWEKGMEPYYPVNNEKNDAVYEKYRALAAEKKNVLFGGRLGLYKYFDMDKVIRASLDAVREELA